MRYHYAVVLILMAFFLINCNSGNKSNEYTGVIEGTVVKIPAMTGGQITAMFADEGDLVMKDQMLATVDTVELDLQRRQIWANLSEIGIQIDMARTNVERSTDEKRYIETKFERISGLYFAESIPQQNFDDTKNQLDQVNKALATARQQRQSLEARKEVIRSQIAILNKKINDGIIRSPRSGVISAKYFETGEAIPPMQAVFELTDINQVDTRIYVVENLLGSLKYGQNAIIQIDGSEQRLTGKLTWISPKAEFTPKSIMTPETRTSLVYAIKVTIDNPDGLLKHGMPVVIELQGSE